MTSLEKQILDAIKIGCGKKNRPLRVHSKYLPEILALVAVEQLKLVDSTLGNLTVSLPD